MIRTYAGDTEAARGCCRAPVFEALADAGLFHLRVPALDGRRRARPADLHPGDRGDRQGRRQHRLGRQPVRDLRHLRGPDAARRRPRDLDRHAAQRGRQHAAGQRARPSWCRAATGSPAARASAPAAGNASWVAAHAQIIENGKVRLRQRRAGDALPLRAGRRGRAARHLARARHARHRHPPLRGQRRLRAGRAHRALGHGTADRDRAALSDPAHAGVRLRRRLGGAGPGPHLPDHVLRPGRRQDAARDAGAPARSVDDPGHRGPGRGRPALRARLPHRGRPRDLGSGDARRAP